MTSLLPIPGGFITLANRCLSPAVVISQAFHCVLIMKGFICGYCYWVARVFGLATQLTAAQTIMSFWVPEEKYRSAWITAFLVTIIVLNVFNVRRYGEIEYWLTVIKIASVIGLALLGLLLVMGISVGTRQLGTGPHNTIIACPTTLTAGVQCIDPPGFNCKRPPAGSEIYCRLGWRQRLPLLYLFWRVWSPCRILGRM
jgi:amino acid permease